MSSAYANYFLKECFCCFVNYSWGRLGAYHTILTSWVSSSTVSVYYVLCTVYFHECIVIVMKYLRGFAFILDELVVKIFCDLWYLVFYYVRISSLILDTISPFLHACHAYGYTSICSKWANVNPLMVRAAKSSLITLMKFFNQQHSWENIWSRGVD